METIILIFLIVDIVLNQLDSIFRLRNENNVHHRFEAIDEKLDRIIEELKRQRG